MYKRDKMTSWETRLRDRAVVLVSLRAMIFTLGCLAASSPALVEASSGTGDGVGGLLHIPSNASLAHCPSSCGDVDVSYPFGIGQGCFRQGFELTCNRTAQPPKLFLGNTNTQITDSYENSVLASMFFNITIEPGMNAYNISWVAPAKAVTINERNVFYVLGCDVTVNLFDYARNRIGSCVIWCYGEKTMPHGGPCNGIGCCSIRLINQTTGFRAEFVRADDMVAKSDPVHSRIMAFMSDDYYTYNATDLFSGWTNSSEVYSAVLNIIIIDQPNCESAARSDRTYACAADSSCENAPYGGYTCYCRTERNTNPYILEGCQDYNPKHNENCPTSCGSMSIPFPFGLKKGCYANQRFQLNCTADNTTTFSSNFAKYYVTGISVEDGTLTVGKVLNNSDYVREVLIAVDENGIIDDEIPVEDEFDFSMDNKNY